MNSRFLLDSTLTRHLVFSLLEHQILATGLTRRQRLNQQLRANAEKSMLSNS